LINQLTELPKISQTSINIGLDPSRNARSQGGKAIKKQQAPEVNQSNQERPAQVIIKRSS